MDIDLSFHIKSECILDKRMILEPLYPYGLRKGVDPDGGQVPLVLVQFHRSA